MTDAPDEFLARWQLAAPHMVADTGQAQVWKVTQSDGQVAALKLYRRADRGNEGPGPRLLTAWKDRGAVRIFKEAPTAILMDWLDGPSAGDIARSGRPDQAVTLLAETARRLHHSPVEVDGLKPLSQMFEPLFGCAISAQCSGSLRHDMQSAIALAGQLLSSQDIHVPLHGDLHPDNIILTDGGPVVIDAKGYVGDPAFELANALRHPKGLPDLVRQPGQIDQCLTVYAEAMQVPRKRLAEWAAAKCAMSIFWRSTGQIGEDPEADLLRLLLHVADQ